MNSSAVLAFFRELQVKQAAELRGVTRQAITHLIGQGKLPVVDIAGKRFVRRSDVEDYKPDVGGRPSKTGGKEL